MPQNKELTHNIKYQNFFKTEEELAEEEHNNPKNTDGNVIVAEDGDYGENAIENFDDNNNKYTQSFKKESTLKSIKSKKSEKSKGNQCFSSCCNIF